MRFILEKVLSKAVFLIGAKTYAWAFYLQERLTPACNFISRLLA